MKDTLRLLKQIEKWEEGLDKLVVEFEENLNV